MGAGQMRSMAAFAVLAAGLASPSSLGAEPTPEQLRALRSARTATISVKQSYRNFSRPIEFDRFARELFDAAGWSVVDAPNTLPDVAAEIEATGAAIEIPVRMRDGQTREKYLGCRVEGRITWRTPGAADYIQRFATAIEPRENLHYLDGILDAQFARSVYSTPEEAPCDQVLMRSPGRFAAQWNEAGKMTHASLQLPFAGQMFETLTSAIGPKFLVEALLRPKSRPTQMVAFDAIVQSKDPALTELLIAKLTDKDNTHQRASLAILLRDRKHPALPDVMARMLADSEPGVRMEAAMYLRQEGAIEVLIDALDGVGGKEALSNLKGAASKKVDHGKDKAAWRSWWSSQPQPAK